MFSIKRWIIQLYLYLLLDIYIYILYKNICIAGYYLSATNLLSELDCMNAFNSRNFEKSFIFIILFVGI